MPIPIANSNDSWISELTDPPISAHVSGFAATGSLTYSDLVAVLNTVVSGGTVTSAEFNDLQTIAANLNVGVATPDDVASEFIQLVDGASVDSNMSNGDGGSGGKHAQAVRRRDPKLGMRRIGCLTCSAAIGRDSNYRGHLAARILDIIGPAVTGKLNLADAASRGTTACGYSSGRAFVRLES
jgi:hypothetical protein